LGLQKCHTLRVGSSKTCLTAVRGPEEGPPNPWVVCAIFCACVAFCATTMTGATVTAAANSSVSKNSDALVLKFVALSFSFIYKTNCPNQVYKPYNGILKRKSDDFRLRDQSESGKRTRCICICLYSYITHISTESLHCRITINKDALPLDLESSVILSEVPERSIMSNSLQCIHELLFILFYLCMGICRMGVNAIWSCYFSLNAL
jgi:hypothetical protein